MANAVLKTLLLYTVTAVAEIVGCFLPMLWLNRRGAWWLLPLAAIALSAFTWLLSLHPAASGRVYAAYGGVYVGVAVLWLWIVDGQIPTRWDIAGALVALLGMVLIVLQPATKAA